MFSDSPKLADYFSSLARTVSDHSYRVAPDGSLNSELGFDHLASARDTQKYKKLLSESVRSNLVKLGNESETQNDDDRSTTGEEGLDTAVFPLLQLGQYGIDQEERATARLLEGLGREERLCLASGYFNLPPQYTSAVLQAAGNSSILAASPQVCL